MHAPLCPEEVRVLGALLEKDMATPEYYPLTVNALQNACNQKSSREPVVQYDEDTVSQALELLQNKGLAIRISGAGHRVEKWAHRLGEKLNLGRRELALLCVLMLRGPQTLGELRGRTERMHDFADLEEVEHVLATLAAHDPGPLVAPSTRGRWVQLLGGEPEPSTEPDVVLTSAPRNDLADRVAQLEREVSELRQKLEAFERQFQ
ncbi:MAG TPA: YceH family protein [Bryobacteraceae bacterium]|nr:YceH family protein [Bryobacteraceae bacterium]